MRCHTLGIKIFWPPRIFYRPQIGHKVQWWAKNTLLGRAENIKNGLRSKKCDFFKVKDNDTTIQPGEKEGQTDVSSALKRFYDHYRGFWENHKFRFSTTRWHLVNSQIQNLAYLSNHARYQYMVFSCLIGMFQSIFNRSIIHFWKH